MHYYLDVLKKYAVFTGRARRSEFWYFVLFNFIASLVCAALDNAFGTAFTFNMGENVQQLPYGYIYLLYSLAVFVPSLALNVRRLHDVGKSGWFLFIGLIPVVGAIWLLVLFFKDSQPGINEYGPNPKGIGNVDEIDQIGSYLQPQ